MPLYDAFISYSHAKDKSIAAALQLVVQTLGKPWYRRRSLRVFRDHTNFPLATPGLWPTIERAVHSDFSSCSPRLRPRLPRGLTRKWPGGSITRAQIRS